MNSFFTLQIDCYDYHHRHRPTNSRHAMPLALVFRRRLEAECLSAEDLVQKLQFHQLQPGAARRGAAGVGLA